MVEERKGKVYLTNGFSPAMLSSLPLAVEFQEISVEEFCSAARSKDAINSIGHQGTISLVNSLCNTNLSTNRISIQAGTNDTLYIITVGVRLEEGKILSASELQQMLKEGKIRFVRATIYNAILGEIVNCYGRCDERTYDYLASKALS